MRISGQGLARLVQFGHNNAKQRPFPTIEEQIKQLLPPLVVGVHFKSLQYLM